VSAERSLENGNESLSSLAIEELPVAALVLDADGRVLLWNRAASDLLGWTAGEVIGHLVPFVPPQGVEGFRRRHQEAFAGGPLPDLVVTRLRKDGTTMELSLSRSPLCDRAGKVFAVLGVVTDITQRLRDEAETNRKETNFRALIERAPDAVVVHRLGFVLYVNPKTVSLLGYARAEDLVGMRVLDIVHPDGRATVAERMRRLYDEGVEAPPREVRLLRKDGSPVAVEAIGLPIVFDGQPSSLTHLHDVTERKRLEAQLMMSDRLAAMGRLAAGVGHEINNPLTYVLANLERLGKELAARSGEKALADLVEGALHGAERVKGIVRDLSVLSRADSEELAPVDVLRVLDTCINVADHQIRSRARVVKEYGPLPTIASSASRLGQVFLNLLLNAAQAIPAQAIPEGAPEANAITIATRVEGDAVVVLVRDTGMGIPESVKARVFDPFFTTKGPGVGTGLGLSICQSIVASLGGGLSLESDGEHGTTARVTLPMGAPAPLRPSRAPAANADRGPRRRVLVIDDEPRVASVLQMVLSEAHDAAYATGGRAALERLRSGERYDVILCDLMMSDLDGEAFHAAVHAEQPELAGRIVFITGGAYTRESRDFLESVPNACLTKPFDLPMVFRVIRDMPA
jgi:PAS domain S-box-containing protein